MKTLKTTIRSRASRRSNATQFSAFFETGTVERQELQEGLMQLNSQHSSKQERSSVPFNGKEEWTAELSLLKKLYARYDHDQRLCGLTAERDLEGKTVLWSVAHPARAEGSVQDSDQSGSAPTRYETSAVDTDTAERAEVPDVPDGTLPLWFYQPVEDQQSEIATVASIGNNEARSHSSSSMYTSSPPSGSSFSLGRPRAKSLVTSSESSMSTPTTESKNLAEELPPVTSKDSDSTGVISNTTKSAPRCDATDASCDPRKHRMSLRPASSSGSSFDWFADGDDDWTDAKYDNLFDELSVARVPPPEDSSEPQYDTLQVWNATEGVWEDVTYQLDQSGMLWDDQNVIGLKVKLMEQAKKLAALHNRVTNVQTQCQQLLDSPIKDLVKEEEALGVRSLLEKQKLLLCLCDLEEWILCTEIGSQQTSIDSFVLLQGLKEIRNTVRDELQQEFFLPPKKISLSSQRSVGTSMVPGALIRRQSTTSCVQNDADRMNAITESNVHNSAPLVPSESTIGDRLVLQEGSMMRLKSSSSSSTNPRPSYPSNPGREPTLTSSPETIALYSRSQHPPSLAVAQPTHSPQRIEAPHSPAYYSTSTPQPLYQEARETNCTFSFESSYRQQHHGRETAPFSPPNYSKSTTQPLSPEAGETNYTLSSMLSDRQQNTRQNRRAAPTSPQNYSTSTTQPMSPEPGDTNYTLPSRSGDHPHLQSRKTAKHKAKRSRLTKSERPLETKKVWR